MKDTNSQKAQILKHLKKGRRLTGLEALVKFGCIKASNRISELKSEGHDIKKITIDLPTHKRVAQYYIDLKK